MIEKNIEIRFEPVVPANACFLWDLLYQAIFVAPEAEAPPREIIYQPELARYVEGWGRDGDLGLYAWLEDAPRPAGAAWLRLWTAGSHGYGWVDECTPELSLAVQPERRGQGLGSLLLARLLGQARERFAQVSLSVTAANPAVRLYRRAGFRTLHEDAGSLTMLLDWK